MTIQEMHKFCPRSTLGAQICLFYSMRPIPILTHLPRRAPPSILNVQQGQPVELRVAKRTSEDYIPPKRSGFVGTGHRLGAAVPNLIPEMEPNTTADAMPGSFPGDVARSASAVASTRFEVDQTLPTTSVQIRLADGTRYAV
jgi:UBX domain-containing protein 1